MCASPVPPASLSALHPSPRSAGTLLLGRCASLTQQAEAQPTVDLVAALRKVRPNKPKLGKRVAIVGNGPSVRGVGTKIDTFDEVVRFNHFWCGGDEMAR